MAERIAEIVILGEDLNHANLARRYLKRLGHSNRNITVHISPSGGGAAEQFVRNQYPVEVRAFRINNARRSSRLVVIIDADTGSVPARIRELENELRTWKVEPRTERERVALLVPKRNVETWILCLNGRPVDEETEYPKREVDGATIRKAAIALFDWTRVNAEVPHHCVPSLRLAFPELHRLD